MSSNKLSPKLAKELEYLINKNLDTSYFPYVKGKSIRIGHIIVRETKVGFFLVFDTRENKEVAKMFCKTAAVALAKSIARNRNQIKTIKELDKVIEKNYNDAIFHKHIMRITKDDTKYFVAETRYDIAAARTLEAKDKLDSFIYV
jgi:hypothetical protein